MPSVILTSPSGSLASDLFRPEIWGYLVKISRREQRTEREPIMIFFKFSTVNLDFRLVAFGNTFAQYCTMLSVDRGKSFDMFQKKCRKSKTSL